MGKYRIVIKVFLYSCLAVIILSISLIAANILKPKVENWLSGILDQKVIETRKTVVDSEESIIIDIVKKTQPSVVSIAVSKMEFKPGEGVIDSSNNIGTGFIVDSSGLLITNQHVVSNPSLEYKVITSDGKEFVVEDIAVDSVNDIAVLKIDAKDLPSIKLGNSDSLVSGQMVIAIGTPLGDYAGSVTTGIISGLNRSVTTGSGFFGETRKEYHDVIQTDAAINPGNSGGPLIDSSGQVIGVSFATTSGADNISFALPVNVVKSKIEEYRKFGKFIRPYLGVEYQMISRETAAYYTNIVAGALIVRVAPDSPADRAGVEKGDIIVKIGDKSLDKSLVTVIESFDVNQEVDIEIWRNGKEVKVSLKLEEAQN